MRGAFSANRSTECELSVVGIEKRVLRVKKWIPEYLKDIYCGSEAGTSGGWTIFSCKWNIHFDLRPVDFRGLLGVVLLRPNSRKWFMFVWASLVNRRDFIIYWEHNSISSAAPHETST